MASMMCYGISLMSNFDLLTFQIIRLESERTQWEQRYLEETAMRQVLKHNPQPHKHDP